MKRLVLILAALFVWTICRSADTDSLTGRRPILSTYALEVGGGMIADTYLSPLRYHGTQLALSGDWSKALPWHRSMSMSFKGRIEGMHLTNPAGNATEWQGSLSFDWLVRRGWEVTDRLTLAAGGGIGFYAGCVYIPRNGNNPASAKAQLAMQGSLSASYRLHVGRVDMTLRDEAVSPLVGAIFSQHYGQPYYNIYLGNRSGLVHAAWWGNNFCVDNLLGVRLHFSSGDLGVGYRFRLYQQHVCNLDTRIATHAAVFSWAPRRTSGTAKSENLPRY